MSLSDHDCTRLFEEVQNKLDSTMPWIGLYVAAAIAACMLAIAADIVSGLYSRRRWIPCKFFSLNAFSLTVLAVAMKLPVDLTGTDISSQDQFARIISLAFMCTCMNHFIISLGSMKNNDILLNIAALGVLVITITVNVCIHIVKTVPLIPEVFYMFRPQIVLVVIMLLLLAMACSVSLMVLSAKRYMELKYNEMHKLVSNRRLDGSINDVGVLVKGYWVMAETSNPQFVLARSSITLTSCYITLIITILTATSNFWRSTGISDLKMAKYCAHNTSNYGWSIGWIEIIQTSGVSVGSVAYMCRLLNDHAFKAARASTSFRDALKVNKHWTVKLVEWRDTPLPFRVQNRVCKKLLCDIIRFVLNFCIGVQIIFVSAAKPPQILSISSQKLGQVLHARFGSTILLRFCIRVEGSETSRYAAQVDFRQYVLLLEGEPELPHSMLESICMEADRLIQQGNKNQPGNLIQLMRKSADFNGVERFDSNQVPSLHSHEPPNCWSLPVVTLMTILVALTDIADDEANQLLASVAEGLSIVKLIEKTLERNGELESIVRAADAVWIGVEVYRRWNDKDLDSTSVRGATHMETLQNFSDVAENIVTEFMAQTRDVLMQNPLNWPPRVIAANSMYRIAQTILVGMANGEHQSDDELFESISITIADILSACLTNLVRVIKLKCHENDFRERRKSVRRAAILLGESREILEILQHRELPCLDVDQAGNIDEWRASMAPDIENPFASPSTSSDDATSPLASPSASSGNAISPLASPSASSDNAITPSPSSHNATIVGY